MLFPNSYFVILSVLLIQLDFVVSVKNWPKMDLNATYDFNEVDWNVNSSVSLGNNGSIMTYGQPFCSVPQSWTVGLLLCVVYGGLENWHYYKENVQKRK